MRIPLCTRQPPRRPRDPAAAWLAYLAFAITFAASVAWLGSIWGKPTWGV